jgi:hypothetical protein
VRAKFLELSAPVWGSARAEALWETAMRLDALADVSAVLADTPA